MSPDTTAEPTLGAILTALRDLGGHGGRAPELLTRETFAALLDVGTSTFDRLRECGKIGPRPIRLAGLKWHRGEALAWLAHRDRAGDLFDAAAWPAVWESLQRTGGTGRRT
jgi:predicted DNA-binding transcriptional regulator AlpA